MVGTRLNRYATVGLYLFSFSALAPLLVLYARALANGHLPPPQRDEGAGAHVFQLSIAALLPIGLAFLASADWDDPAGLARRLALPTVFVGLAFGLLYYYEHVAAF